MNTNSVLDTDTMIEGILIIVFIIIIKYSNRAVTSKGTKTSDPLINLVYHCLCKILSAATVCIQIFEGHNFCCFHGKLVIHEN